MDCKIPLKCLGSKVKIDKLDQSQHEQSCTISLSRPVVHSCEQQTRPLRRLCITSEDGCCECHDMFHISQTYKSCFKFRTYNSNALNHRTTTYVLLRDPTALHTGCSFEAVVVWLIFDSICPSLHHIARWHSFCRSTTCTNTKSKLVDSLAEEMELLKLCSRCNMFQTPKLVTKIHI